MAIRTLCIGYVVVGHKDLVKNVFFSRVGASCPLEAAIPNSHSVLSTHLFAVRCFLYEKFVPGQHKHESCCGKSGCGMKQQVFDMTRIFRTFQTTCSPLSV